MLDLSIIIVNYNTKEFLKKSLDSILSSIDGKLNYEIIVVDNASTDGSPSVILNLKSKILNLKTILNKENLGFSRANNIGIKASKASRYVLFLNPDTIMQKNTVEDMLKFMDSNKSAGAATCKLVMLNGEIDDASHRGFPTPWNAFSHFSGLAKIFPKSKLFSGYNLGWMDMNSIHEIDALAGAFMLVRREAGEKAKWWDEDYFFYGEDIDFCYMLKQKGWKIYYVPTVFVTHYKGVSGGIKDVSEEITTASEETKKRATKWRFNAMRIFYKKHYEKKYPWIVNQLVNLGISIRENL
ncbi:MAG: glycosyltransferase family 2 protein [Candidatus Levybacteria bacterium]|nr:glycosyltransferase family 2 protein [Candidatus Levybacteria bacterium]